MYTVVARVRGDVVSAILAEARGVSTAAVESFAEQANDDCFVHCADAEVRMQIFLRRSLPGDLEDVVKGKEVQNDLSCCSSAFASFHGLLGVFDRLV